MLSEIVTNIVLKSIEALAIAGSLYFLYSLYRDVKKTFWR